MFVAKSHTLLFTVNFITSANYFNTSLISLFYVLHYKIICILIISGSGLFMLSEEANFMILRRTIKLFVKHVVPSSSNYGNGVGKLIMTITQNLCIAVFTFSLGNLLICIIGFIAVWNQKFSLLRMYQIMLGFLLLGHLMLIVGYYFSKQTIEDHLKDFMRGLMTEYVSLRSGTPASLFTASIMVMLNCCGATYRQFGWRYAKFDPNDTYDNILYKGINQPIPCCKMNDQLEIIDTTCPFEYTKYNSNIGIGCDKPFAEEISLHLNTIVLGSISVLLINVIMLCIGVKAIKDFNPINL
uniref:Tetraspanin n=1 Tax=Schistosoma haematobium TaxID=6185 RepID=A0A094ZMD4_SCHHA